MKKTNYTATYAGQTFTRTSARAYTHAAIGIGSRQADKEESVKWAGHYYKQNLAYNKGLIAAGEEPQYTNQTLAEITAYVEGGIEGARAAAAAEHDARNQGKPDTYYFLVSFNSSQALAAKEAAKHNGVVVEVTAA